MYLPDLPRPAYHDLLAAIVQEFTYTFGGSTTDRGLEGSYLSRLGLPTLHDLTHAIWLAGRGAEEKSWRLKLNGGSWRGTLRRAFPES